MDTDLTGLLAREHIRECIARVARAEDRRDAELLRGCYWPDAAFEFGMFSGKLEAYVAWIVPGSPAVPVTQHVLGQSLIALEPRNARVETHVLSYHRIAYPDAHKDVLIGGRYLDRFVQRDNVWRIAERSMLYDFCQDLGPAVDWSQGLLGTPFSSPHHAGRAAGDFSETFFGKRLHTDGQRA